MLLFVASLPWIKTALPAIARPRAHVRRGGAWQLALGLLAGTAQSTLEQGKLYRDQLALELSAEMAEDTAQQTPSSHRGY